MSGSFNILNKFKDFIYEIQIVDEYFKIDTFAIFKKNLFTFFLFLLGYLQYQKYYFTTLLLMQDINYKAI